MNFVVTEVKPERREVRVEYGSISLTCRVLETNGLPYIQKPPYTFISSTDWHLFVDLVRNAWNERKEIENGNSNSNIR